jgi:hypothetical protein
VYTFDGIDDRIEYPSSMLTPIASGFSAAAWVQLNNVPDIAVDSRIICSLTANAGTAVGEHNFRFVVGDHTDADSTVLSFRTTTGSIDLGASSTGSLTLDRLHHVAFTYDGSNLRFYIDGVLDSTVAFTTACGITGTQRFQIGSGHDNPANRLMEGRIAEVAYWDRVVTAYEMGQIGDRDVGRSPLSVTPGNLKFYATLHSAQATFGGAAECIRNLIDGTAGTLTGTTVSSSQFPLPAWKHVLVRTSPADGGMNYQDGTYAQARAGTAPTVVLSDQCGGSGELPQLPPGVTHQPFGQYTAQVYQNYFAFDFHRVLPPDAFVGAAGFVMRNGLDATATVTNVCELREYEYGVGPQGGRGALTAADFINCDNLGNYALLGTKTSAPGSRFTANSDVHFDSKYPAIRDAIRRDRFTQVSLTTDRQRNANTPADDETIHPIFSETSGVSTFVQTYMWVMYYREGQFARRTFPHPRLRKALA